MVYNQSRNAEYQNFKKLINFVCSNVWQKRMLFPVSIRVLHWGDKDSWENYWGGQSWRRTIIIEENLLETTARNSITRNKSNRQSIGIYPRTAENRYREIKYYWKQCHLCEILNKLKHHKTNIYKSRGQNKKRNLRKLGAFARAEVDSGSGKHSDKGAKGLLDLVLIHWTCLWLPLLRYRNASCRKAVGLSSDLFSFLIPLSFPSLPFPSLKKASQIQSNQTKPNNFFCVMDVQVPYIEDKTYNSVFFF